MNQLHSVSTDGNGCSYSKAHQVMRTLSDLDVKTNGRTETPRGSRAPRREVTVNYVSSLREVAAFPARVRHSELD